MVEHLPFLDGPIARRPYFFLKQQVVLHQRIEKIFDNFSHPLEFFSDLRQIVDMVEEKHPQIFDLASSGSLMRTSARSASMVARMISSTIVWMRCEWRAPGAPECPRDGAGAEDFGPESIVQVVVEIGRDIRQPDHLPFECLGPQFGVDQDRIRTALGMFEDAVPHLVGEIESLPFFSRTSTMRRLCSLWKNPPGTRSLRTLSPPWPNAV